MKSNNRNVIVSGSSITDTSAWPTWATWVQRRYNPENFINCGVKGIGNELIILKAIAEAKKHTNPIILLQLTNVDKWDWYVENLDLAKSLVSEKHALIKLSDSDNVGFWSTGSHFPTHKEYFKENYFGLNYFAYRTLQLIHWFQLVCLQQCWQYYIIFDSPILAVTEQYLNNGTLKNEECTTTKLIDNTISEIIFNQINTNNIYLPGIIGYAQLNSYKWFTQKSKGHPGSLVHYYYTRDIVTPVLDQILHPVTEFKDFEYEAMLFQKLFDNI